LLRVGLHPWDVGCGLADLYVVLYCAGGNMHIAVDKGLGPPSEIWYDVGMISCEACWTSY
jgi:hypothetical protein